MGSVEEFVAKRFRPSFCDVPPVVLGRSAPTPIGLSHQDHPLATPLPTSVKIWNLVQFDRGGTTQN